MDPDATLLAIDEALARGDAGDALSGVQTLIGWIIYGGFSPDWREHPRATVLYDIVYALRACNGRLAAAVTYVDPQAGANR